MLTLKKITEINNTMIEKGSPTNTDGRGYNRPDYYTCSKVKTKLFFEEALLICVRLKKYTNTQLKDIININDINESIEIYENLSNEIKKDNLSKFENKNLVKYIIQEDNTYLFFYYNKSLIKIINEYKGFWDGEKWIIKTYNLNALLNEIKAKNIITISLNKIENDQQNESSKTIIYYDDLERDLINITFSYNKDIVELIKIIPNNERKWDSINKKWILTTLGFDILKNVNNNKFKIIIKP